GEHAGVDVALLVQTYPGADVLGGHGDQVANIITVQRGVFDRDPGLVGRSQLHEQVQSAFFGGEQGRDGLLLHDGGDPTVDVCGVRLQVCAAQRCVAAQGELP